MGKRGRRWLKFFEFVPVESLALTHGDVGSVVATLLDIADCVVVAEEMMTAKGESETIDILMGELPIDEPFSTAITGSKVGIDFTGDDEGMVSPCVEVDSKGVVVGDVVPIKISV